MDKNTVIAAIGPAVSGCGCFLVDVEVTADNDITIAVEKEEGVVGMDDCVSIDKAFHALFDQDVEDYSLTVTSAGLDQPFKVLKQFRKAVGTKVEVLVKGGRKLVATLLDADEASVTVRHTVLQAVEGKKKKVAAEVEEVLPLETVNAVRPFIEFE